MPTNTIYIKLVYILNSFTNYTDTFYTHMVLGWYKGILISYLIQNVHPRNIIGKLREKKISAIVI